MKKLLNFFGPGSALAGSRMGQVFLVVLCAHFLLGLFRIPRTVDKKLGEIGEFHELGPHTFPFRGHAPESAKLVTRLATSTPPSCLLYYEGVQKGYLEIAAALLYPRLLVRFDPKTPIRKSAFGRTFARLQAPDGSLRYPVIQAKGKSLGLRWQ